MSRKPSDIQSSVMEQIIQGSVRMRPKVYFTILTVLSAAAVLASALSIAYFISIGFFWLRIQTAETMAWGARTNLSETLQSFPWWALALSVALLVGAALLVKYQGKMHRHKLGTIIIGLLTASVLLGSIFSIFGLGGTRAPNNSEKHGPGSQRYMK